MAYGDYSRTTELEAVNTCLSIIGEQPVNSLDLSGVTKASLARDLIYNVSRRIQNEGLNCNTEIKVLTPNISDEIQLPGNAISVEPVSATDNHFIERDSKLYDRKNNTYTITDPVTVRITYFLEWTDLPEHVRNFTSIVAARIFQTRYVSDEALHMFSEMDEAKAQAKFARLELDSADLSGEEPESKSEELEIINMCLDSVRETPQTTLTSVGTAKARHARTLLNSVNRSVQNEKLNCNTARRSTLEPDVNDAIVLPTNCLDVTTLYSIDRHLTERNGQLYDQKNHTYTITRDVVADVTVFLPFNELPEHVRGYIKIRTIRLFQKKYLDRPEYHTFTDEDEYRARAAFMRKEYFNMPTSILDNVNINPRVYRR